MASELWLAPTPIFIQPQRGDVGLTSPLRDSKTLFTGRTRSHGWLAVG